MSASDYSLVEKKHDLVKKWEVLVDNFQAA